jgi:hypothetical protein
MTAFQLDDTRIDEIVGQARQVSFSRVLLTLFLGFFWVLGLGAGKLWLGMVIMAIAVRRGWRDGTGWIPPAPTQPIRQ